VIGMPHDNDTPKDLKESLRHFHIDLPTVDAYMPRDFDRSKGPALPPDTHFVRKGGFEMHERWGDDMGKQIFGNPESPVYCGLCGTQMYYHHEEDDAFIGACPYPGCPNNPDTKGKKPWEQTAKKSMDLPKEKQF